MPRFCLISLQNQVFDNGVKRTKIAALPQSVEIKSFIAITMDEETNITKDQAGPAASAPAADEQSACEKQRDEYLAGWKRSQADFINYKKEEARRLEQATEYAALDFARELLPVLDSFELGIGSLEKDTPAYKGMLMIRGQLIDGLRKKGIERIVVARGDAFNPEFHEAMMEVEPPAGEQRVSGTIIDELVPGYTLRGRVIRASKVSIAK